MFDLRVRKNGRPLLVGHRGSLETAPENTMLAFQSARDGGADILELDVQLTSDNQVVVFHDVSLELKTGVPGTISMHSAEFLRGLDVGRYFGATYVGARMPFLDEVLAWAKGCIPLMIELKHGPVFNPALDAAVVGLIADHRMEEEVVLISADQFALQRVKQLNPHLATSFIFSGRLINPLALVDGLDVDSFSPRTDLLTQEEVERIHAAGYACSPGGFWWDYPRLIGWGVDTISSNNPAAIRWPDIMPAEPSP
ncbi:MAG: hypothetical protein H6659_07825 [Ardenticatenaceae bacterium]|nr:hypothetical protein [Ardenticatenaceae bacterium]MCB8987429.1 hypothetical protein [Ardenticatenaceae bacterium]